MTLTLKAQWIRRLKLREEGYKLRADAAKAWLDDDMLKADREKLRAKGLKLWAKADKLWVEAEELWVENIQEVFGKINLKWIFRDGDLDCHLGNGEVYRWDMPFDDDRGRQLEEMTKADMWHQNYKGATEEIERLQNVNKAQARWLYDEQQAHKALRDKVRQWLRDDKPDILKESE